MAVSVSAPSGQHDVWGRTRTVIAKVTFDNSYAIGGEPISAHQFDLAEIKLILAVPQASGYVVQPNAAKTKLLVYRQTAATSALVEVPDTTDLSALVVDVLIAGI